MKTFREFLEEEVFDSHYEFTHGKKPRGTGNWIFSKHQSYDPRKHDRADVFSFNGSYSEAKKKARSYFNGIGHRGRIFTQT